MKQLGYAIRQLGRAPGFAITAILTLALGIGANSTILSWISTTLFNPIPAAKNVDRMLSIQRGERSEHPVPPLSYPDFADLRANAKTFSGMIAAHQDYISITGTAKPERIYGELASADYFEVLGVQPYLGRTLVSTRANEKAGAADRGAELQPVAATVRRRSGHHRQDHPTESPSSTQSWAWLRRVSAGS